MGEQLVARLHCRPTNAHDLEAFVACFARGLRQRAARATRTATYRGARAGARELVGSPFTGVPDILFSAPRLVRGGRTRSGAPAPWSEWRWEGTQTDGRRLSRGRGVDLSLGVQDDLASRGRVPLRRARPSERGRRHRRGGARHDATADPRPVREVPVRRSSRCACRRALRPAPG
jgi:hypothetical protein